jgi:hypothetical protein
MGGKMFEISKRWAFQIEHVTVFLSANRQLTLVLSTVDIKS